MGSRQIQYEHVSMPKLYSSPQAGLNWSILAKSQSCVRGAGNPDNVSDEHPNTVPDSMLVVRKLIAVTRHRPWSGGDINPDVASLKAGPRWASSRKRA
jgi:hypothetical protein